MAKEIDRARAQGALAVIKQHPGMVLFVASPVIIALGLVWWLVSPTLAVLLVHRCSGRRWRRAAHEAQVGQRKRDCSLAVKAVPSGL